jgi:general secretion pathway protein E
LVRVLCSDCKSKYLLTEQDLIADPRYGLLGLAAGEKVYRPVGCESCGGTGYRGRAGIFELLELTDDVRPLVGAGADAVLIDGAAIRAGMTTMLDDAVEKCRSGMTAAHEVLRVTSAR